MKCNCCERRLVVNEIDIVEKGHKGQKMIFEVVTEELVPLTTYCLVFGQPIPEEGEALPVFIRAKEGKLFGERVRVREIGEDDCDCEDEMMEMDEDCHKRHKLIQVDKACLGNVAFGEDFLGCKGDYPRRRIKVFLNNAGHFTMLKRNRRFDED